MTVAKPTETPRIATDASTCVEPAESGSAGVTTKNTGVIPNTRTPAQYVNWWLNNIYTWILWIQDINNQTFTNAGGSAVGAWTGAHEFDNTVYFQPLVNGTPIITQAFTGSNSYGAIFGGDGSGDGVSGNGGETGDGAVFTGGTTSGDGLWGYSRAGDGVGVNGHGHGAGFGASFLGGTNGGGVGASGQGSGWGGIFYGGLTGGGIQAIAGGGNQYGGDFSGAGTAAGVRGVGAIGPGILGNGGTNSNGVTGNGNGTGSGCLGSASSSGNGVTGVALGSGHGGNFTNALGTGYALFASRGTNTSIETAYLEGKTKAPLILVQLTAGFPAIRIREGYIALESSQPAPGADPGADNCITATQIDKAWGTFFLDGAGVMTGTVVLNDGLNVSVTMAGAEVHVAFIRPMAFPTYAVTLSATDGAGNQFWIDAKAGNKTVNGFTIFIWASLAVGGTAGTIFLSDARTETCTVDFAVKARQ